MIGERGEDPCGVDGPSERVYGMIMFIEYFDDLVLVVLIGVVKLRGGGGADTAVEVDRAIITAQQNKLVMVIVELTLVN